MTLISSSDKTALLKVFFLSYSSSQQIFSQQPPKSGLEQTTSLVSSSLLISPLFCRHSLQPTQTSDSSLMTDPNSTLCYINCQNNHSKQKRALTPSFSHVIGLQSAHTLALLIFLTLETNLGSADSREGHAGAFSTSSFVEADAHTRSISARCPPWRRFQARGDAQRLSRRRILGSIPSNGLEASIHHSTLYAPPIQSPSLYPKWYLLDASLGQSSLAVRPEGAQIACDNFCAFWAWCPRFLLTNAPFACLDRSRPSYDFKDDSRVQSTPPTTTILQLTQGCRLRPSFPLTSDGTY